VGELRAGSNRELVTLVGELRDLAPRAAREQRDGPQEIELLVLPDEHDAILDGAYDENVYEARARGMGEEEIADAHRRALDAIPIAPEEK
jgi:hypothetical protein